MKSKEPLRTKDERQPASEPLLRSAAKPQGKNGQGAMVHIQRTVGNQAAQRLLSSTGLTIMKPGHEQEKAAERNAEAISAGRKPEPATLTNSGLAQARLSRAGAAGGARSSNETAGKPALESPATAATLPSNGVAGKLAPTAPASCRTIAPDSRVGFSGAKISAGVNGSEGPPAGSNLNSGQPLPLSVRRFFEQKFEHDLGGVRVYVDDRAAQSAAALHASAYTVGGNIIFGRDAYKPGEPGGIKLLAHELSHVLQQSHGAPRMIQRKEPPDTEEVATTDYGNGLVLQQWPARGLALLTYRGRNWMQFAWTPGEGRQL